MTLSGRGGKREGAGRPKGSKGTTKPEHLKAHRKTFRLYDWEVEPVRQFIKSLRQKKED